MSNKSLKIAQKFAPVLCCELSKDRRKRIYECFSAINFHPDKKPCEMEDRIAKFNSMFPNLDETEEAIESTLIPSIYYSLIESKTHYFMLYTIYHALDQKSPFGHEHDMEHIQVVVRKSEDIVEYVTTNAHHAYFYYVNEDNPVRPHPPYLNTSENGYIVLHNNTHPVVYIQPGDGSISSVFNEEIGHGIFGIGGVYKGGFRYNWRSKWHSDGPSFEFENKDGSKTIGIIALHADDNEAKTYAIENEINLLYYQLENVEDTIWQWFTGRETNNSLCKNKCKDPKKYEEWLSKSLKDPYWAKKIVKVSWKPCLFRETKTWKPLANKIINNSHTRKEYFKKELRDQHNNLLSIRKIQYPSGICGSKNRDTGYVRVAGGAWPFEFKCRTTGERFYNMTNKSFGKKVPTKTLEVFFDPAAAYKIMVTVQEPISTDYIDYPYA